MTTDSTVATELLKLLVRAARGRWKDLQTDPTLKPGQRLGRFRPRH